MLYIVGLSTHCNMMHGTYTVKLISEAILFVNVFQLTYLSISRNLRVSYTHRPFHSKFCPKYVLFFDCSTLKTEALRQSETQLISLNRYVVTSKKV